jgi:Na+/alanine symporter
VVKTLKLVIHLFLECQLQIWFQKYDISPSDTQFLINKDKNREAMKGVSPPQALVGYMEGLVGFGSTTGMGAASSNVRGAVS